VVGPNGALWTHQVVVTVPKVLKIKDRAVIYNTGACNENPSLPKSTDEELAAIDDLGSKVGIITVLLYQNPNCHLVFPSDPSGKKREEDAVIAWGWYQFIKTGDPEWLPHIAMAKAVMQGMRAVQQYTAEQHIADIDGWIVSGASKRGWTTWLVGCVKCPSCPTVVGIAPVVPIVPDLRAGLHHMYRSYGGWSFAFQDYLDVNLTQYLDDPSFANMMKIVDPIYYADRLERLPKIVSVSSDDEFMMMEWTRLWWSKMPGETHLMIANNAEHSMASGIFELIANLANFVSSVSLHGTRPSFTWDIDLENGVISVTIPSNVKHGKVVLRHATTLHADRRDFRWVAAPVNGKCKLPEIGPVKGSLCVQPIIWTGTTLEPVEPNLYRATLTQPHSGWLGAYVEVYFPSDTGLKTEYQLTTAGMVWPQTYPSPDCQGAGCAGHIV
jgi:PhoPQ-activated pathogenicity-related protein